MHVAPGAGPHTISLDGVVIRQNALAGDVVSVTVAGGLHEVAFVGAVDGGAGTTINAVGNTAYAVVLPEPPFPLLACSDPSLSGTGVRSGIVAAAAC